MKNVNKHKVTVGISAFNEQRNIAKIIDCVLEQQESEFWKLEEVLILSDGSSDKTAEIVKSRFIKPVKVYDYPDRQGKPTRIQQMFQMAKGDFVIILDADISIIDVNFISKLLQPLLDDKKAMMSGGLAKPRTPTSFLQRAVNSTYEVFYEVKNQVRGGNNMFGMSGRCLALKSEFAKQVRFPNVICEDDYLYFLCLHQGYKFVHAPDAVVYHKLPKTLKDYLKQNFRCSPEAVELNYEAMFGPLVKQELYRPWTIYIKSILKVFSKTPLEVVFIGLVNISCKPLYPLVTRKYNLNMYTAGSTK